jgi:tRNA A37 threonylcarbamoyladenosine biosynthesis protein TsaE
VDWTDAPQSISPIWKYKMPYFDEVAKFYEGNIILIGAAYGEGKTTISVNFIKQLKEQKIKPYYIPLESGSSFEEDVKALGLTHNDYYTPKIDDEHPPVNPMQIEIQPHAFTIIDWLDQAEDFAKTQSILKHFNEEMRRVGGILVIFVQIRKTSHDWFAPDLINTYPAFAARFGWDDGEVGLISHFNCDKIRNPIGHYSKADILTKFNFDTKEIEIR